MSSATDATPVETPRRSGVRGRALLYASTFIAGGANYAFGLLCVHMLGGPAWADVAAVTSISMIITVPLSGLQAAYGRDVAMYSVRDTSILAGLRRHGRRQAGVLQLVVFGVAAALVPLAALSGVGSWSILLTLPLLTLGASVVPIVSGFLQGLERYSELAAVSMVGGLVKFAVAPFAIVFAGSVGAASAGAVGAVAAGAFAMLCMRRLRSAIAAPGTPRTAPVRPVTTVLATVALISYAVLSNVDLVIANIALGTTEAGDYAAATIAGRGVAFIAVTTSIILLTSTSRRISEGADTWRPVVRTMAIVAAFGVVLSLVCLAIPASVYATVFNTSGDVTSLVAVSVLAFTAAGLVNNLLSYSLAHRMAWFVRLVVVVAVAFPVVAGFLVHDGVALAALLLVACVACIASFLVLGRPNADQNHTGGRTR